MASEIHSFFRESSVLSKPRSVNYPSAKSRSAFSLNMALSDRIRFWGTSLLNLGITWLISVDIETGNSIRIFAAGQKFRKCNII